MRFKLELDNEPLPVQACVALDSSIRFHLGRFVTRALFVHSLTKLLFSATPSILATSQHHG